MAVHALTSLSNHYKRFKKFWNKPQALECTILKVALKDFQENEEKK